eukprot:6203129-Pleurochrysis_carterae.AAC.1
MLGQRKAPIGERWRVKQRFTAYTATRYRGVRSGVLDSPCDQDHASLQWRIQANLILFTRTSIRAGKSRRNNINADRRGLGASAGAEAGARLRGGPGRGAQWAAAAIASTSSFSLGSGARALRKYACETSRIWETVHVSVGLQMKGARDDSL